MILQWTQHADLGARWATGIGGTSWPIVITEVNGHTLVFEDLKGRTRSTSRSSTAFAS